ncbi:hypothetical protein WN943_018909 [Citrus x changshan-huyou]
MAEGIRAHDQQRLEESVHQLEEASNQFFKYNGLEEFDMVGLATIHLEGKALVWFQGYEVAIAEPGWRKSMVILIGPSIMGFQEFIVQVGKKKNVVNGFYGGAFKASFDSPYAKRS